MATFDGMANMFHGTCAASSFRSNALHLFLVGLERREENRSGFQVSEISCCKIVPIP